MNDSIIYGDIEQFINFFKYSYDIRLEKLGLTDKAPRGDALNPGRWSYDPETWDPYGTNNYRDCVLRPSEHYAGTDANPIIDLCGVLSPYTDNPDATPTGGSDSLNMDEIRLTCYDEGGLLDSYR